MARSWPIILAGRRDNWADTLTVALTPKAIIWIVMQITKIHFLTWAALVVRTAKLDSPRRREAAGCHRGLRLPSQSSSASRFTAGASGFSDLQPVMNAAGPIG